MKIPTTPLRLLFAVHSLLRPVQLKARLTLFTSAAMASALPSLPPASLGDLSVDPGPNGTSPSAISPRTGALDGTLRRLRSRILHEIWPPLTRRLRRREPLLLFGPTISTAISKGGALAAEHLSRLRLTRSFALDPLNTKLKDPLFNPNSASRVPGIAVDRKLAATAALAGRIGDDPHSLTRIRLRSISCSASF